MLLPKAIEEITAQNIPSDKIKLYQGEEMEIIRLSEITAEEKTKVEFLKEAGKFI